MLSYSHDDKELCYKIHKRLITQNFRVWLDRDAMRGSTIEAMVNAIEQSKIVLLCVSDSYKTSPSCQSEAEFAYQKQRPLIPLIMRDTYRPDGWLLFIIRSRTYINYPKLGFEKACDKLIEEIQAQNVSPKSAITSNLYHELPSSSDSCAVILDWTHTDILNFLSEYNLQEMYPLLKKMNGQDLFELYKMCDINSAQMYQSLKSELLTLYNETLPINVYLRFYNQLKKYMNT
ncbi:unnamed protein product [Didymodactylos carnosus]|nr:unnamed protein product [Didymodactylos carnosus]CAF4275972.1 unnamed protein product [Didymodactylos carnosus]